MKTLSVLKICFLILILAGCYTNNDNINNKKLLYNGIILPEQWPPRYDEPDEPEEMPVPYLANKPEIIPINIGRQLFVDDFLIAETNLISIHHTPNFYKGNPVFRPDKEWEIRTNGDQYAAPFSDGIWYDEKDQKFKMWYLAGGPSFTTAYAESKDGKHWEKPILGIHDTTNIIDTKRTDSQTIWLDKQEKDHEKRYKIFQIRGHPLRGRCNFILRYSADGINWSDAKAVSGLIDDRSTAFYNPFRNVWVLSLRYWSMKYEEQMTIIDKPPTTRSRTYIENKDPEMAVSLAHYIREDVPDINNVFWFGSSDKEPRNPRFPDVNPGIYNFDAIAYESIMLGFISVWQGPENPVSYKTGIDKRNEILLGYSRDGFHFSRPSYKPFMGVNEQEGSWNFANVQSINGVPVIVGDTLYFYSSGRKRNKSSVMSTGLATLRRDGFVSMKAGNQEGYLTTEKLNFDGKYLFVNADVEDGQLFVEVIDDQGTPLKGFTRHDCVAMQKENSTKHMITWNNKKDLAALKVKNISFKFFLTNGEIYAFWVSPWETGESRGYTAGGGPGLSFDGIDRP